MSACYINGADGTTRVSTGTIRTWVSCNPSLNGYLAMKDSIAGPTSGQLTEAGVNSNGNVVWAHTNVRMPIPCYLRPQRYPFAVPNSFLKPHLPM